MTRAIVESLQEQKFFEKGAHTVVLPYNELLDDHNVVNVVKVYVDEKQDRTINIVGTDLNIDVPYVTISDMVACFSYFLNHANIAIFNIFAIFAQMCPLTLLKFGHYI